MTEDEEDKLYAEVGRQRLQAFLESTRAYRDTFKMAVLLNWTPEQTKHYIKTGEMPNELLKGQHLLPGNNVD